MRPATGTEATLVKRLTLFEKIFAGILGLLLMLGSVAWWKTRPPTLEARKQAVEAITTTDLVDQTTYTTAQRLARLALTPEEQNLAQSALRIADHELDLAFSEALIDAEAHPPALNSDAQAIQARIVKSQSSLNADQQQVSDLTAAIAQARPAQKDDLQNQLDVAQSQMELDKDELDQGNQDLADAGGNPRQQIELMMQEHDAQSKSRAASTAAKGAPVDYGRRSGSKNSGLERSLAETTGNRGCQSGRARESRCPSRETLGTGEQPRNRQERNFDSLARAKKPNKIHRRRSEDTDAA